MAASLYMSIYQPRSVSLSHRTESFSLSPSPFSLLLSLPPSIRMTHQPYSTQIFTNKRHRSCQDIRLIALVLSLGHTSDNEELSPPPMLPPCSFSSLPSPPQRGLPGCPFSHGISPHPALAVCGTHHNYNYAYIGLSFPQLFSSNL